MAAHDPTCEPDMVHSSHCSLLVSRERQLWTFAAGRSVDRLEAARRRIQVAFERCTDALEPAELIKSISSEMRIDETIAVVLLNRAFDWLNAAFEMGETKREFFPLCCALMPQIRLLRNMHEHCIEYQLTKKGHKQGDYISSLSSQNVTVLQGAVGCTYLNGELFLSNRIALSDVRSAIAELVRLS